MADQKLIANRYRIEDVIGEGGMGTVYRGADTRSGHPVAIKELKPELLSASSEAIERFRREVEALRRLDHPNIVKLLGTAREGQRYYIVMEYLGGGSLAGYLSKQPNLQLPVERALQIALDLTDALTRAHRLNIIHRDLKPDNVLLTEDGVPRLTDFGIARIGDQTRLTQSGSVMGTGFYLSPEACRGYELDARADIWAFGVVLYEMLAGRRPFGASTAAATMLSILMEPLPDLREFRPDAPPALAALVTRMLEKNPDNRIASIRQVGAHIEAILNGTALDPVVVAAPGEVGDFVDALVELVEKWEKRVQEALGKAHTVRLGDQYQAYFHRGVAETYKAAAEDIRELLAGGEDQGAADAPQMFVQVSRRQVETLMERAGMKVSAIYEDKDYVFSIVFPKIPPMSAEERIARLKALAPGLIVLESGRLQDTQQPFVEFGFTTPPD